MERLQALGYVGTFAPVTDAAATDDPKDRLKDYQAYRDQFNRALGFLGQERPREAQVILQRLLKTERSCVRSAPVSRATRI